MRGETFVTRKITRALARIKLGFQKRLYLGNLEALRDWGHARDYVAAMHLMLQQDSPDDFVIATGEQHSVREFVQLAADRLELPLNWSGQGRDEQARREDTGEVVVSVDPRYFRPTEVESLLGNPAKAQRALGWQPQVSFAELVAEMADADMKGARREATLRANGYEVNVPEGS